MDGARDAVFPQPMVDISPHISDVSKVKVELLRRDEEFYKMWLQNVVTKCGSQLAQYTNPHHDGFTGEGGVYFTRTMGIVTCSIRYVKVLLIQPTVLSLV